MHAKQLIVIEDDSAVLEVVTDLLVRRSYVVAERVRNLADALKLTKTIRFDCAIVDLLLFGEDVAPLVVQLQSLHVPFVLITGALQSEISTQWLHDLPHLVKPFGGNELVAAIEAAITRGATHIGPMDTQPASA